MKSILKSFFFNKEGRFIVPWFWATIFLSLLAFTLVRGIITGKSDPVVVSALVGIVLALIGLYNNGKRK